MRLQVGEFERELRKRFVFSKALGGNIDVCDRYLCVPFHYNNVEDETVRKFSEVVVTSSQLDPSLLLRLDGMSWHRFQGLCHWNYFYHENRQNEKYLI